MHVGRAAAGSPRWALRAGPGGRVMAKGIATPAGIVSVGDSRIGMRQLEQEA